MFGFKKELYAPEYQLAGDECAVIETSKGTIKVKFDGEGAPIHVANFSELSTMGFYDGLKINRYVPGFVIQGGDPKTRDISGADVAAGLEGPDGMPGTGGPGYTIKDEFSSKLLHDGPGVISMANRGPNTGGSQFFITLRETKWLDGKHAVFGKVSKGMDVVYKIGKTATDSNDKPLEPVIIKKVTIEKR